MSSLYPIIAFCKRACSHWFTDKSKLPQGKTNFCALPLSNLDKTLDWTGHEALQSCGNYALPSEGRTSIDSFIFTIDLFIIYNLFINSLAFKSLNLWRLFIYLPMLPISISISSISVAIPMNDQVCKKYLQVYSLCKRYWAQTQKNPLFCLLDLMTVCEMLTFVRTHNCIQEPELRTTT